MTKPIMLITYNSLKREDWDLIALYVASWYRGTLTIYPLIEWKIMVVEQARAQIFRIRSTKADTIEAKAAKAEAIVNTVENTVKALKSVK